MINSRDILIEKYEDLIYELAKGEGSKLDFQQNLSILTNHNIDDLRKVKDLMLAKSLQRGVNHILDLLDDDNVVFDKKLCVN